eukprot:1459320-Pleurochrysis_carterae.AAC.1
MAHVSMRSSLWTTILGLRRCTCSSTSTKRRDKCASSPLLPTHSSTQDARPPRASLERSTATTRESSYPASSLTFSLSTACTRRPVHHTCTN